MQNVLGWLYFEKVLAKKLLTYLLSQSDKVRNSAIFQMTILMHMNVYGVSYYTFIQIKS